MASINLLAIGYFKFVYARGFVGRNYFISDDGVPSCVEIDHKEIVRELDEYEIAQDLYQRAVHVYYNVVYLDLIKLILNIYVYHIIYPEKVNFVPIYESLHSLAITNGIKFDDLTNKEIEYIFLLYEILHIEKKRKLANMIFDAITYFARAFLPQYKFDDSIFTKEEEEIYSSTLIDITLFMHEMLRADKLKKFKTADEAINEFQHCYFNCFLSLIIENICLDIIHKCISLNAINCIAADLDKKLDNSFKSVDSLIGENGRCGNLAKKSLSGIASTAKIQENGEDLNLLLIYQNFEILFLNAVIEHRFLNQFDFEEKIKELKMQVVQFIKSDYLNLLKSHKTVNIYVIIKPINFAKHYVELKKIKEFSKKKFEFYIDYFIKLKRFVNDLDIL